mgnify:CR=1 FL=1
MVVSAARKIWSNYCAKCDGIVFLVDAAEPERFPEAKKELHVRFIVCHAVLRISSHRSVLVAEIACR